MADPRGIEKNYQGGGGANQNPKNPGIDLYSGFRKNGHGGVQIVKVLRRCVANM